MTRIDGMPADTKFGKITIRNKSYCHWEIAIIGLKLLGLANSTSLVLQREFCAFFTCKHL
jgi:hypothetical protein